MPPRYAYWTIIVDEQPTAFRAASQEDLMPTFKRLKDKNASAKMMWFQNGKLWPSRVDAQEAMRARGEAGRRGDTRQRGFSGEARGPKVGGFRDRQRSTGQRSTGAPRDGTTREGRPEWKPKAEAPSPKPSAYAKASADRHAASPKPSAYAKASADRHVPGPKPRLEWKPKGTFPRQDRESREKLEWKPRGEAPSPKPSAYAKATADRQVPSPKPRAGRDKNWRPGGEHRDPRQKYKDAKKAKWTRFKQAVRKRWEAKQPGKPPGKKRRDDE